MESDSSGPRRNRFKPHTAGALVALLVFLTWAAAAYAAVGGADDAATVASSTAELGTNLGPAARLAALVVVGFLPAVILIARAGRNRPVIAELPED